MAQFETACVNVPCPMFDVICTGDTDAIPPGSVVTCGTCGQPTEPQPSWNPPPPLPAGQLDSIDPATIVKGTDPWIMFTGRGFREGLVPTIQDDGTGGAVGFPFIEYVDTEHIRGRLTPTQTDFHWVGAEVYLSTSTPDYLPSNRLPITFTEPQ